MGKADRSKRKSRVRKIPLNPETRDALLAQTKAFKAKFGHDPGPGNPVFFDPNSATPKPMNADVVSMEICKAMVAAGIRPALVYAYQKTGRLLTEENSVHLTEEEIAEFCAAVDEYAAVFERAVVN